MSAIIITPNIAYFKEGEVYVYTLPEKAFWKKGEPHQCRNVCDLNSCVCQIDGHRTYQEAVSYARAHPFKVHEKDREAIINLLLQKLIPLDQVPLDLTEYRIKGLKFEIKEEKIEVDKSPTGWQLSRIIMIDIQKVACLIEDDGVKN